MGRFGNCRFCRCDGKLVDAHIIPKAFYLREGDHPFMVMNATRAERPIRSQKGLWDDTILCEHCEARFARLDSYAAENLQQRRTNASPVAGECRVVLDKSGAPALLALPWVSAEQIILFALFVLWRAAESSRPECKGVSLGPFLNRVRDVLDQGRLPADGVYVTLWWERDPKCVGIVFLPYRSAIRGVRLWNFWCGGFYFIVQTDSRPNVFSGSPNFLEPNKTVQAISTSLLDRKEGMQLALTVKRGHRIHGDPWKGRWRPKQG
jgi:hypothetical protein